LEIVDPIAGTPTGRILGVQVKAGPSYFRRSSLAGWTVAIKKATVTYWRQYAVPVILVIVDPNAVEANWVRVDVADFPATKRAFNIAVPRANVFSSTTAELLAQIAAPVPASLLMRGPIMRRGIVLVCLPPPTAAFARSRGFVPKGSCADGSAPIGKTVAAIYGDTVEIGSTGIAVNGHRLPNSRPLSVDAKKRSLQAFAPGRYVVGRDDMWLVSSYSARSFDSRYFGPVNIARIVARFVLSYRLDNPIGSATSLSPVQ
jgi:conjugative transfer signal peptidase TraF